MRHRSTTSHFASILKLRLGYNSRLSYRDVASVPSFASRDVGNRPDPLVRLYYGITRTDW